VQKLLREKDAQAIAAEMPRREAAPGPVDADPSPGIDVFRLIALRDRLSEALES
jgi:hypothetical protein